MFEKNLERMKLRERQRKAISPIIATLLLILIAIAAGVVVYAYVIGFVGQNTTGTGTGQAQLSIDMATTTITSNQLNTWTIVIRNVGTTTPTISAIYFQDNTAGGKASLLTLSNSGAVCGTNWPSNSQVSPQSTITCTASGATLALTGGSGQSKGDSLTVIVVATDGSTGASAPFKSG